jgi:Transposase DDE domain
MTDFIPGTGSPLKPPDRVKKPPQTYTQAWSAYNLAQARELRDFVFLLNDLCNSIPEELSFQQQRGRHRISLRDLTFASVLRTYYGLPGRKFGSSRDGGPLADLHAAGFLSRSMHWNSMGNALRDERMSEVFKFAIEQSALPLIPIEEGSFSVDASVVDGARRIQEGDPHYPGQTQWRIGKGHFIVSNKTHVIVAAAIGGPGAGESPLLPGLLHATSRSFQIERLFGDKAYADYRSYRMVEALGGQGWFPFRQIHTGRGKSPYSRMYHWAEAYPAGFWGPYFIRSNVEATISSWKRVLLRGLREKTATLRNKQEISMRNELYSVFIAHNIRVVIRYMYLLGLSPTFLPEAKDAPAYDDPLPLPH